MSNAYPPSHHAQFSQTSFDTTYELAKDNVQTVERTIARTPSPTPSEANLLNQKGLSGGFSLRNLRQYVQKKYIPHIIIGVVLVAITVLTIAFHDQIINWLKPTGEKIRDLPAGWLIPVAILIVLSFPPLFGHEFVHIICGVVWGIGVGFAIVALGTLLGEVANFLVFRYFFRARAEKYEKKNLRYGLLAHVVRNNGLFVAFMMRMSAIPPHFTTIVFTLSGMSFFVFFVAAVLSLPRQFGTVVLGTLAASSSTPSSPVPPNKLIDQLRADPPRWQKLLSAAVIIVTILFTLYSMRFINRRVDEAKPVFVRLRQKARCVPASSVLHVQPN
ncbi:hypothetical protein K488DRAFT_48531 [Vararia minispora EC-137]|uniref:Uncharacterized protein n=1 Tax=Vararia minispora EC-137 TaxID=1314806 RepID=A0ACB8QMI5_9AGAM|nr:hypothetical protein K488DRAFT_48531 [Vararia minispora EC-137]